MPRLLTCQRQLRELRFVKPSFLKQLRVRFSIMIPALQQIKRAKGKPEFDPWALFVNR